MPSGAYLFDVLWQDLCYGFRMLLKSPGLSAIVVMTLALGIGANAALFSVVNGVLLNPLPFPQPEQLVTLHQSKPDFETGPIPYQNFLDWQNGNRTFSSMAVSRRFDFIVIGTGETERVSGLMISADYFTVLGIKPALGRTFLPSEDDRGAHPVTLISAGLWQRKFASAPDVLEKSLTLDDKSYTIVGVLPASFKPPSEISSSADVYVPIGQWNHPALRSRAAGLGIYGIGRIKPGMTIEQAQSDLSMVAQGLAVAYPDTNKDVSAKVVTFKEMMVGDIRLTLLMLLGAVGFVLLIACVNVSNLLLARSTSRTREFATRAALGASPWRLFHQLLTESVLLAIIGGVVGAIIANLGTKAVRGVLPITLPRADEVEMDGRVLLFTLGVSLITGILSGLAPGLRSSQRRLSETLKEGGRGASAKRHRTQGILVVVEMSLALVLLIAAGLMIRSLSAVWNVDPGFRPDNILTFGLSLPPSLKISGPGTIRANLRELNERISAIPGVQAASFSWLASPLQYADTIPFWIDGRPKPSGQNEMNTTLVFRVEPEYLTAMGIPLKQGRFFTNQDDEQSLPVAVIDEVFARKYFGTEDPLGKRIYMDINQSQAQVVGVVGHIKQWGLDSDDNHKVRAQLYRPFRQLSDNAMARVSSNVVVIVRAQRIEGDDRSTLFGSIRRAIQSQNGQNTIFGPQTMNETIGSKLATRRFSMMLFETFAMMALLLASVGLYSVISYIVGQQTHEFGIRLALGAQRKNILRLVLIRGMKLVLSGIILGLVAAFGLTRLMANLLFGVSATDPATFAIITFLLLSVALLACFIPALRATKVDPLVALRHD